MKYDVTFTFLINGKECPQTIAVYAETESDAIFKARHWQMPDVPSYVPAVATPSGAGGSRKNAGVKEGTKRTNNPRTIKKQNSWTATEWPEIEAAAEATGETTTEWQRRILLAAARGEG